MGAGAVPPRACSGARRRRCEMVLDFVVEASPHILRPRPQFRPSSASGQIARGLGRGGWPEVGACEMVGHSGGLWPTLSRKAENWQSTASGSWPTLDAILAHFGQTLVRSGLGGGGASRRDWGQAGKIWT